MKIDGGGNKAASQEEEYLNMIKIKEIENDNKKLLITI